MTTAAEQQTLTDIAAAQARGEDPFGDDEVTTAVADDAPELENELATGEPGETTSTDALSEEALQEIADEPASADPLQFNAQVPADYKTARSALLAEKAEAMAKLMGGELESSEYAAIEARVMDSLEDLSAQRIRAETLIEANAQTAAQAQQTVIQSLIVRAKDEVPYATDAKAARQFDMALQQIGADPDYTGKPFAHLVNEAHKVVMALRGVQAKPAAASAAARKPDGAAPMTL